MFNLFKVFRKILSEDKENNMKIREALLGNVFLSVWIDFRERNIKRGEKVDVLLI